MKIIKENKQVEEKDLNYRYNNIRNISDCNSFFKIEGNEIQFLNDVLTSLEIILKDGTQYNRNEATVVGLIVKVYKCLIALYSAINEKKGEIVLLFFRPIFEACIVSMYLSEKGEESQRNYRLIGFKLRYKNYKRWEKEKDIPNSANLLSIFKKNLMIEGFSIDDLDIIENIKTKNDKPHPLRWNIDCKNFRDILKDVYGDNDNSKRVYDNIYSNFSEITHGSYLDVFYHNIFFEEDGIFEKRYPNLEFKNKFEIKLYFPIISVVIDASINFQDFKNRFEEIPNLMEYKRITNLVSDMIVNTK